MWPSRNKKTKKTNPEGLLYRIRPTDVNIYDHYVLEWEDQIHEEWVYIRTVSKSDLLKFINTKPTS